LEQARSSVASFNEALNGEREKYRLGFGSLVDILTIEDRLTGAFAAEVRARLAYAMELARLRRATGTIVDPRTVPDRIDATVFHTAPALAGRGPGGGR
jgi:outer membrane protein TolC